MYPRFLKRTLLAVSIMSTSMSTFAANELAETWTDSSLYQNRTASQFTDVAATPDGNFVAVGKLTSADSAVYEQLIVKFNKADGTLDTSFAGNGQASFSPALDSKIEAVAVQADGKILTVGVMRASTSDDWQLIVQRLNADGTPDLDFADDSIFTKTQIDFKMTEALAKDIVINSRGEIIFTVNVYKGASYGVSRYYSKLIKLDADGVEDTNFSTYVTSNTEGTTGAYSTELTSLIMDNNNNIFALGQLNMVRFGQEPKTQSWTSFADVIFGGANTNGGIDTTWLQNPSIDSSGSVSKSQINGATITPNNLLISVGCDSDESNLTLKGYNLSTGESSTTFGTNGSEAPAAAPYLYSIDCFNDVIYHSTHDALFTVGASKNRAIILASDPDTGATIDWSLNSSASAAYESIALLEDGSMAVVGSDTNKALVTLLTGDTLTASSTVIDDITYTDQTNVQPGAVLTSENQVLTITPATPVAATVYNGSFVINNAYQLGTSKNLYSTDNLALRHTASSDLGSANTTSVFIKTDVSINASNKQWSVGDKFFTFTSKTVDLLDDTTPDAFSFSTITGTDLGVLVESEIITIAGINASTDISISSGEYSINGGAYQTASGTVSNGDTVKVRQTSSNAYYHYTNLTLTIGGESAMFYSQTKVDDVPDTFSFTSQFDVAQNSTIISDEITIAGMSDGVSAEVTITNGEYSINGGEFTTGSTSGALVLAKSLELISEQPQPAATTAVSNGDTLVVRQTTSSSFDTQKITTVSISGVEGEFITQTISSDNTPDSFAFTSVTDADLDTEYASNKITISGINVSSPISVKNGTYSINDGVATDSPGYVSDGDSVQVFVTSSDTPSTESSAIVVVGGISKTYVVTTAADTSSGVTDPIVTDPGNEQSGSSGGGSIPLSTLLLSFFIVLLRRKIIK